MKKLIPPFLKKLDNYLLLNHPLIWVSRIHYVVFVGIIMSAFSALVGTVIPLNISQTQDLGLWYFLFTIIAIVALCFWIYHNVIFNIEKKSGKRKWTDEYKIFFLNFICVLIFSTFPLSFTAIYNSRVAHTISDEAFIDDINTLNIGETYLINNINNYQSYFDSAKQNTYYDFKQCTIFDNYTPWKIRYDSLKLRNLLSGYEIKDIYKNTHTEQEIKSHIKNYINVYKKYHFYSNVASKDPVDTIYKRYAYLTKISPVLADNFNSNYFYDTYELENVLNNISQAKFTPLFIWDTEVLHLIFYTCLYLSLLIMLFKMVQWKQFLITLLSLMIVPIILFITSQLIPYSSYSSKQDTFAVLLLLTFFVAFLFMLSGIAKSRKFNAFKNICAQIVYLVLPILPLMIVLLCKSWFFYTTYPYSYAQESMVAAVTTETNTNNYYNSAEYIYYQLEQNYWSRMYDLCECIAMYGGLALFVIVIVPLMKQLFVKQLALPRKS